MTIVRSLLPVSALPGTSPAAARVQDEVTIVGSREAPTRLKRAETSNFIVYSDGSAEELVRQGKVELARRLLHPLLHGGYASPERSAAWRLFAGDGSIPDSAAAP